MVYQPFVHIFFCTTCIRRTLETCLDAGEIPMYCPACKATHGKNSDSAKIGRIETPTLTFLARRDVIPRDLQFRIMMAERKKRNASEQGKESWQGIDGSCRLSHE